MLDDTTIMAVYAERDAARDEVERVKQVSREFFDFLKSRMDTQVRRSEVLAYKLKQAEAKILPEACDTKRIIEGLTKDLNDSTNRLAELEEALLKRSALLQDLTCNYNTLKSDYERLEAENRELKSINQKLEKAVGILDL